MLSLPALVSANVVAHRSIWTNTVFAEPTIYDSLNQIFAFNIPEPKPLGVMWFIRTLFFVMLLAPLYKIVARRCVALFPIGVAAFLLFAPDFDFPHFPMWFGASIWFYLGMWIGVAYDGRLVYVKAPMCVPLLLLLVGVLWGCRLISFKWLTPFDGMTVKLCFIVGLWLLYDHVVRMLPDRLPRFVSWSFWLYCTHNMVVLYAIACGRGVFGRSDVVVCMLPILVFVTATVVPLSVAWILYRKAPRLFSVVTGERV